MGWGAGKPKIPVHTMDTGPDWSLESSHGSPIRIPHRQQDLRSLLERLFGKTIPTGKTNVLTALSERLLAAPAEFLWRSAVFPSSSR